MRDKMSKAWEDPAVKAFKTVLSEIMDKATKDDFRSCMEGRVPEDIRGEIFYRCKICWLPAPITCITLVARKYGLEEKFRSAWQNVPETLKKELMDIEQLWTNHDRALAQAVTGKLNISELYNLCVNDEYEEVQKRLNMPFRPAAYRECMSCVAKFTNLAKAYKKMWGKIKG
jgi:hypothetical protein